MAYSPANWDEQLRRAAPVIRHARALIWRGWCRCHPCVDAKGFPVREAGTPVAWSLDGAIAEAGRGEIEGEFARRVIRKFTGPNIPAWNDHPLRIREEVLHVLDRALQLAGDEPPRRGGWTVGTAHQQPRGVGRPQGTPVLPASCRPGRGSSFLRAVESAHDDETGSGGSQR